MLIAFHRDPARKKRAKPYLWPPKNGAAALHHDVRDQEVFVDLRGVDRADDVQLKLRSHAIVARRDPGQGWSGVEINDHQVRVLVDDIWIEIHADGTVVRETADSKTFLEGDGSIIKTSEDADVMVSADSSEITRRTPDRIDAVTADGILSKPRQAIAGPRTDS
ncbi:hypothetical protein [Jannaschia aquimarina]|nr:hypothetical protein [Jannaschia aquimarina]